MGVITTETQNSDQNHSHYIITLYGNTTQTQTQTHTISTTLTSHPATARKWLHSALHHYRHHLLRNRLVIGLGVQWSSYEHSLYHHPAAIIQLCIGRRCLIFHLTHSPSCPLILRRILSDPRITLVGLWNSQDSAKLLDSRHRLETLSGMPIDLRRHVEGVGLSAGVAAIAESVLGVEVEKCEWVGRSDWEVDDLCVDQVEYAAVDAFVAYAIAMRLRAWEFNPFF